MESLQTLMGFWAFVALIPTIVGLLLTLVSNDQVDVIDLSGWEWAFALDSQPEVPVRRLGAVGRGHSRHGKGVAYTLPVAVEGGVRLTLHVPSPPESEVPAWALELREKRARRRKIQAAA